MTHFSYLSDLDGQRRRPVKFGPAQSFASQLPKPFQYQFSGHHAQWQQFQQQQLKQQQQQLAKINKQHQDQLNRHKQSHQSGRPAAAVKTSQPILPAASGIQHYASTAVKSLPRAPHPYYSSPYYSSYPHQPVFTQYQPQGVGQHYGYSSPYQQPAYHHGYANQFGTYVKCAKKTAYLFLIHPSFRRFFPALSVPVCLALF